MQGALRPSALIPPGFTVECASTIDTITTIAIVSAATSSCCPICGTASHRTHSRYVRKIADLPLAGCSVKLLATVRRFWCDAVRCGRRIFAERFADGALAPSARRTGRLDGLVHHLGLALGGRPGASLARRLMLPVSNDTLLRVVRRHGCPPVMPPTVIGIDDGHGGATSATVRSSAISNGVARSACCPIANLRQPRPGSPSNPRSRSSRGIVAGRMPAPRPGASSCHTGRRLLAPDGERQSRVPRCCAPIDAADPPVCRGNDHQPRSADRSRAPPV